MFVVVTAKLPRNPEHDPRNKVTGPCPVNGFRCTDATGEHHTMMVAVPMEDDTSAAITQAEAFVRSEHPGIHITRSEACPWAHEA